MRTPAVDRRLSRDFPGALESQAAALVDRVAAELGEWEIVGATDRVEAAALEYAQANLEQLKSAIELAIVDWRDLLVSVGDA